MSALAELRKMLHDLANGPGSVWMTRKELRLLRDGLDARDEALRGMIRDNSCFCEPEHQFECSTCKAKRIVGDA